MREIGSEFHTMPFDCGSGLDLPGNGTYVFSGRTAIETVLKELSGAKKAILPSYCCDSMIQPFRDAGINVDFYQVNYEDGLKINARIPPDTDIFLWCNYFGYSISFPSLSDYEGIIIEDITHSLLSRNCCHPQSHYLVASIRKWEPIICGGYCASVKGKLPHIPMSNPPESFIELKTSAMKLKSDYLSGLDMNTKPRFLSEFAESNHWLSTDYSALSIDSWSKKYLASVDVEQQRQIRRNNAKVLYKGLSGKVEFLFPIESMDCPLFVPVLLPDRDEIRKILTVNRIYCPVHWPKPAECQSNLYDLELSLVCDQRYDEDDMQRIVSVLNKKL